MTSLTELPVILDEDREGDILALPPQENEAETVAFADRLLSDLKDCRDERAQNEAARKLRVEQINLRYADLDIPLERREARLLGYLEQIAHQLPMGKKRSRDLAYGRVGWRHHGARLEVTDDTRVMEWVKQQPFDISAALTRKVVKESLDKKALDALTEKTGEIPDGCTVIPAADKFYAEPTAEPHP